MQIVLSYSIHGAYWAYTKNQAAGEAVLLEVIGRISGAARPVLTARRRAPDRYLHSVYGL